MARHPTSPQTRVTRAVSPADLAGLLRVSRYATVAWAGSDGVAAEPAAFDFTAGTYRFGLVPGRFPAGIEATLVVDAGRMYFDLRGVRVRGIATRVPAASGPLEWFEVAPEREFAWHYGRMRDR
jgi:hypothetical protein